MFRSNLIKLGILAALFIVASPAEAKTVNYASDKWELPANSGSVVPYVQVRNDLDFAAAARRTVLGKVEVASSSLFDDETIAKVKEISTQINQPAQDAHLVLDGKIAKEFNPGQKGQGVDVFELRKLLANNQTEFTLPVITSEPANKLSETNNLGINELVAVGESDFTGSPANRIHNVTVGANKFNGLLIDQGEEFSFNKYLGEVDDKHGFLPELVIKKTGVVPEFGGGLCQVSSTAFRGAMNAGLPITERRNHSFAVQYYAPQGTDATIYPGVVDLKFVNDTPGPLLVRTKVEGRKLYFEYYGTKDNRAVAFDGPVQYDKKLDGSMKATWTRRVTMNGETKEQTFRSTYQPPALFHKEEQTSTPNPQTEPTPNNQPVTLNSN